ncbi:hypothetical protein B0A52_02080 [Exophiala mesophila]|uniref:AA9 family lytic polysaccharide monooxygenase n=1 Tax=Exophiala mesophila TaxID=212818 RepID=A0A438NET3_EXOME|nr:hypothetical protein B0A52_02080 [Exophiala mesophila]
MAYFKSTALFGTFVLLSKVQAHGHVTGVIADGEWYSGYIPSFQFSNPPPVVAGWTADNLDNGFVSDYSSPDIICHKQATPGGAYIKVAAGSTLDLQWTEWPESHHGPVFDFLAPCGDDCTTIDKTSLLFTKIDEAGLIDGSSPPGHWASDDMIANNSTWSVTIPSSIAPGRYVLRHDTIALHAAHEVGGSQAYPQCFNLEITGSGSNPLTSGGVPATEFFQDDHPGIFVNIYQVLSSYVIPGPPLLGSSGSTPPPFANTTASATTSAAAVSSTTAAVTSDGWDFSTTSVAVDVDITASITAPTAVISTTVAAITTATTTSDIVQDITTDPVPQPTLPSDIEDPISTSPVSFSSTVTGRIGKPTRFVCYIEE